MPSNRADRHVGQRRHRRAAAVVAADVLDDPGRRPRLVARVRAVGRPVRSATASTARSPAATASPAPARSSTRWPTRCSCSARCSRSSRRRVLGRAGASSSPPARWSISVYRVDRRRRGRQRAGEQDGEVQDVVPAARGRRSRCCRSPPSTRRWLWNGVPVGSRSCSPSSAVRSTCGCAERPIASDAGRGPSTEHRTSDRGGPRCAVTCSPSVPSCCSARSSTPTRRGSASSSRAHGIDSLFQAKVGDNLARIVVQLRRLLGRRRRRHRVRRARPDPRRHHPRGDRRGDGRRRSCATRRSPSVIRQMFAARGRTMADNNLRQADVPVGRHDHPPDRAARRRA